MIQYRRSTPSDLALVGALIQPLVASKLLLPRSEEELAKLLTLGFLADHAERGVVGFAAVEVYSRKMAELQCLAVDESCRGQGIGKQLVRRCVGLAADLGVHELMAITSSERLFQDVGFDYSLPNQKRALFIHPGQRPADDDRP